MKDAAEPASPSASELHAALLDYFSAPGKYQLTLRQPALLFASIRDVLHIAAGRGASADLPAQQAAAVREAAAFFIRAALLYPGADHYALLGLPARTEPVELKERYRLLMRLIHPDYAEAGAVAWPADAAVRVNRANEVLSSPVLRKEYDEQLAAPRVQRVAEGPLRRPVAPPRPSEKRAYRGNRKVAWAVLLFAALVAVGMLLPGADPVHLVQKTPKPRPPMQRPLEAPAPADEKVAAALVPTEVLSVPSAAQPPPPQAPATTALPQPSPAPTPMVPPPLAVPPAVRPIAPAPPPVAAWRHATPANASIESEAPRARPTLATHQDAASPVPPPRPQEQVVVAAPAVPSAPPPVTAPAAPPLIISPVAKVSAPIASPTLADAQPLLTQLLQMLESGSGDQLLRLLDADARQAAAAQALSRNYDQTVGRARPVRLTQVDFKGEPRDGVLVVTGRIRLHAGEPTIGSHGERFLVRAEFASRGGKVMLTGLSGGVD